MASVTYSHIFPYPTLGAERFPALQMGIAAPQGADVLDVDAFLDSGATGSLFDGDLLLGIGLNLMEGEVKRYQTTLGTIVEARLHRVELRHDQLGSFELVVGFSTAPIARNLLGRDFFNLAQIGFRERHLTFFIEPTP